MRELIIRSEAQFDIDEAAIWYELRRPALGVRFLEDLDYVMKRIAATPFQFPEIHPGVRRGRFPYSVYFSMSDEQVEVIAVLHQRRHPDTWMRR
jgi:plasmid stabilization system protein ParE